MHCSAQEAQKRFEIAQKQYLRDQAAWRAAAQEAEDKAAAAEADAAAKVAAAQADIAAAQQQRCSPSSAAPYLIAWSVGTLWNCLLPCKMRKTRF